MSSAAHAYKSKTLATWIALVGGSVGLHRFYLHGLRDVVGWLFFVPTLAGVYGVQRMRQWGGDDHLAWLLIPLVGLTVSIAMLTAVVYGLAPDDKWNARFNPHGPSHRTGWLTILGVITALFVGAGVLMATIAFSAQRYFEYQMEPLGKRVRLPIPQGPLGGPFVAHSGPALGPQQPRQTNSTKPIQ